MSMERPLGNTKNGGESNPNIQSKDTDGVMTRMRRARLAMVVAAGLGAAAPAASHAAETPHSQAYTHNEGDTSSEQIKKQVAVEWMESIASGFDQQVADLRNNHSELHNQIEQAVNGAIRMKIGELALELENPGQYAGQKSIEVKGHVSDEMVRSTEKYLFDNLGTLLAGVTVRDMRGAEAEGAMTQKQEATAEQVLAEGGKGAHVVEQIDRSEHPGLQQLYAILSSDVGNAKQ